MHSPIPTTSNSGKESGPEPHKCDSERVNDELWLGKLICLNYILNASKMVTFKIVILHIKLLKL